MVVPGNPDPRFRCLVGGGGGLEEKGQRGMSETLHTVDSSRGFAARLGGKARDS